MKVYRHKKFIARPLQEQILKNTARKIVIVAHRRFGKTTYALMKILQAANIPDSRFFYIAPTYRQAKLIAWDQLLAMCPPELIVKKNEMDLIVQLSNGTKIELKGADTTNKDSLRGVGLDGCVLDEFSQMEPSVYSEVIRPALTDKQGFAVFISTPKGKNHFYDLYENTNKEDRYLFKASDTGILLDSELSEAKKEMSTDEYSQEFECGFLYFAGQIYKEFNRDIHIVRGFKIDDTWLVHQAIDYGQVNPTAMVWYATDFDDNLYVIDEYEEGGKTIADHVKATKGLYTVRSMPVMDPSAFARTRSMKSQDGMETILYSVADEFNDNGMPCIPANNDVTAGINRVKEYFQKKKLFIFERCVNLIKEIDTYRWKDKKRVDQNAPEEPVKLNDHLVDALRYAVMSRPEKPKMPQFQRTMLDRQRQLFSTKKAGGGDWYDN